VDAECEEYPSSTSSCLVGNCLSFEQAQLCAEEQIWVLYCKVFELDAAASESRTYFSVRKDPQDFCGFEYSSPNNPECCPCNTFTCNGNREYTLSWVMSKDFPMAAWEELVGELPGYSPDVSILSVSVWKVPLIGMPAISKLKLAPLLGMRRK